MRANTFPPLVLPELTQNYGNVMQVTSPDEMVEALMEAIDALRTKAEHEDADKDFRHAFHGSCWTRARLQQRPLSMQRSGCRSRMMMK